MTTQPEVTTPKKRGRPANATKTLAEKKDAAKPVNKETNKTIYDLLKNRDGKLFLYDFLKHVSKISDEAEQVELLRLYANRGAEYELIMRYFVECMFHPSVQFNLPLGTPPDFQAYPHAKDPTMAPTNLFNSIKKVGYFIKGTRTYIENDRKRNLVFLQIAESLYIEEAKLFFMIKDRKLDRRVYPTLTFKLFQAAFPSLLPNTEQVEKNV